MYYRNNAQLDTKAVREQVIEISERIVKLSQDPSKLNYAPAIINIIYHVLAHLDSISPHNRFHKQAGFHDIGYSYLSRYERKFNNYASDEDILSVLLNDIALDVLNFGCSRENLNRSLAISTFILQVNEALSNMEQMPKAHKYQPQGLQQFFDRFKVLNQMNFSKKSSIDSSCISTESCPAF